MKLVEACSARACNGISDAQEESICCMHLHGIIICKKHYLSVRVFTAT